MTLPTANDGARPSRFLLDRYATGELSEAERLDLEARLDDAARAYLAELDAARAALPPLDLEALRSRAARPLVAAPEIPEPANRSLRLWFPLLVAALIVVALAPRALRTTTIPEDPVTEPTIRVRGEGALLLFHLEGERLVAYDGRALGAGDAIGFQVRPGGYEGVVLLSLDAEGEASLLYPEVGAAPEPIDGDGRTVPLPGTIVLDDAPGPELFVAIFDQRVPEALAEAADRYGAGGAEAVREWAAEAAHVDVIAVERR